MSKVIDGGDRVTDDSTLPAELRGKSPAEIVAYFGRREGLLQDELRTVKQKQTPAPKATPESADVKIDVFGDADRTIKQVIDSRVNDAVGRITTAAVPSLVAACRAECAAKHPDFAKFADEIDATMKGFDANGQITPLFWESTYNMIKGKRYDADLATAVASARNPVERTTPRQNDPPKPRQLSADERTVAAKFTMSDEEYAKAADRWESNEGRMPFTLSTKKKKIA